MHYTSLIGILREGAEKLMTSFCAVTDVRISANVLFCFAFVLALTIANVASNSSTQDEGNACFDMAAAVPRLQNITGNHLVSISKQILLFS